MPDTRPTLTVDAAAAFIAERSLAPTDDRRVGIEMEWLTVPRRDPARHVDFDLVRAACEAIDLPAGSRLTFEPGGQIEVSCVPAASVPRAIEAVARDGGALAATLAPLGIDLVGVGLDARAHRRVIDAPRYRAMEAYFDADGPDGRRMMCRTASIQVNLEAGSTAEADRRWKVAHAIAPTLGAAFANSPLIDGAPSGWRSSRLATWQAMDPTRTAPAVSHRSAVDAWVRYALDARVMFVRDARARFTPVRDGMTLRDWLEHGHACGYPTRDDVAYHLTTLFPPVRLRGWLELRFLDSLPDPWWRAAVTVTAALLDDDEASARAEAACAPAADLWHQGARHGLAHPVLAAAARGAFEAALDALPRLGVDAATIADVAAYHDRFVARARTPADEALDEWQEGAA